jgi:hypothetical protein
LVPAFAGSGRHGCGSGWTAFAGCLIQGTTHCLLPARAAGLRAGRAKGHPSCCPEASDATAIKQQGQGEEVLSGPDCMGLEGGEKMYCNALQFGVRLAIIVLFRRLA